LLSLAGRDVYGVTHVYQNIEKIKTQLDIPNNLEVASIIPIGYKENDARKLQQKTINTKNRIHFEKG